MSRYIEKVNKLLKLVREDIEELGFKVNYVIVNKLMIKRNYAVMKQTYLLKNHFLNLLLTYRKNIYI